MSRKPRGRSCGFEEVATSSLFLTLPPFFPLLYLSVSDIRTAATHTLRRKYPAQWRTAIKYSVFSDHHTQTHTRIRTVNTSTIAKKKKKIKAAEPDISSYGEHTCTYRHTGKSAILNNMN